MSDLVDRLHKIAVNFADGEMVQLLMDAAACIQRLEPENYYLKSVCDEQKTTIAVMRAEIDRLSRES